VEVEEVAVIAVVVVVVEFSISQISISPAIPITRSL
jgi:hypothetical protein